MKKKESHLWGRLVWAFGTVLIPPSVVLFCSSYLGCGVILMLNKSVVLAFVTKGFFVSFLTERVEPSDEGSGDDLSVCTKSIFFSYHFRVCRVLE